MGAYPVTTARVNGRAVVVRQSHRRWAGAGSVPGPGGCVVYEPVLVTVSAPVGLSLEDVAALLFGWALPEEELDDDMVRALVAETVLNEGCAELEEQRCSLEDRALTAWQAGYLAVCRDRARAVFGGAPVPSPALGARVGVV